MLIAHYGNEWDEAIGKLIITSNTFGGFMHEMCFSVLVFFSHSNYSSIILFMLKSIFSLLCYSLHYQRVFFQVEKLYKPGGCLLNP